MRKLILPLLLAGVTPAGAAPDVTGLWMTQDEDGAVLIEPCGEAVCGRIVWLRDPLGEDGRPVRDGNNHDAGLRARPVCGLTVIDRARARGEGWEGGTAYDPESGGTYSVAIARGEDDTLSVTGYVGVKALGQTFTWRRAPATLKRCDGALAPGPAGKPRTTGKGT